MDPSVITAASNAAARCLVGWHPREFTWASVNNGDRTMVEGAGWTLLPNGTATFEGAVTSRIDDDAWVIWHVDLVDAHGRVLGSLATEHPVAGDWRKFVRAIPETGERYEFRAWATFDAGLWPDIAGLTMYSSC
jgi:hypothetical protein